MRTKVERLTIIVIVTVLGLLALQILLPKESLKLQHISLTEEERLLAMVSRGMGDLSKYQMSGVLPQGSRVRVWVESYLKGERMEDSLTVTHIVSKTARDPVFYVFQLGQEISVGFVDGMEVVRSMLSPYNICSDSVSMGTSRNTSSLEDGPVIIEWYIEGPGQKWGTPSARGPELDNWIEKSKVVHLFVVEVTLPDYYKTR